MEAQRILRRRGALRPAMTAATALLVAGVVTGCGSSQSTGRPVADPSAAVTGAATVPATAAATQSDGPSDAAHIVCTDTAETQITGALGIDVTKPLAPTWTGRTYSCRYVFSTGSMRLSVKDLPDQAATTAWFTSLRTAAPGSTTLGGMGEGAFQEPNGNVVVRKDNAVLVVDVTALPATVGLPVRPRATAARTVAQTVLICWKEYG
ncbi:hypothetical protein ACEZCY_26760 [Streptacidiphilus sp. N1-12]|uniref:DUF3558 domain-containing protein n=2 Tax=Streptacidiphilus alkalitolerans TaxID=3342712 RepID=A0ABV6WL74_9ACTN